MELRSLRYFVAVASKLSFSRAAESLHVSQSALSRQVMLLEEELRLRLFDRVGRRIVLTPAGEDLLNRSRAVLNDADALKSRAEELAGGARGVLRIGATPQTLESLLSRVLTEYLRRTPGVVPHLVEDGSASLVTQVEMGLVHVAVAALPPNATLQSKRLFPLRALAVLPRTHRFAGRGAIEISELSDENLLLLRAGYMTRQLFDGASQVVNLKPRVTIESANPHCLLALAAGGHGVAIIPSTVRLAGLRLPIVPLHQSRQPLELWMSAIWDGRRYLPPAALGFIDAVHDFTRRDYPGRRFIEGTPSRAK